MQGPERRDKRERCRKHSSVLRSSVTPALRESQDPQSDLAEMTSNQPVERASKDAIPGVWETLELKGEWKKRNSAGGSRNFPSYHRNPAISFCVPINAQLVKVALRQHNQENLCHAIGFHVYLAPVDGGLSPFLQEPCAACIPHSHSLEVSQICDLAPGQYFVVPSTYLPDQEGKFSIFISLQRPRGNLSRVRRH
ncbi:unnamed protein product [Ranitomeya imitator]|uniref:Peptidase C2 calpain domain-containing protein n=1 Tax=Ranitomeya imitator TaxID=111125 RepID=A0ABN9LXD2_9NEOB|nr:unnamed protein product [Ranitomeya imitator]